MMPRRAYNSQRVGALLAVLHIVVVPHLYPELGVARRHAEALREKLAKTEPFTRHEVRWHFVENADGSLCRVTEDGARKRLTCTDRLLNLIEGLGLPRPKVVVLSAARFTSAANVRSAGWMSRLDLSAGRDLAHLRLVFLHELGHSLGLVDEGGPLRTGAPGLVARPGWPNCAPDRARAEAWWGDLVRAGVEGVGYFEGCDGWALAIRPHRRSVMNGGAHTYGAVNERHLDRVLRCEYALERSEDCARYAIDKAMPP
jgi:hypothetical protein